MIRWFFVCLILAAMMIPAHVRAEEEQTFSLSPEVIQSVPEGQETVGPYHQPQWAARGKFSSVTEVYVLPPYFFYVDLDYEGTIPGHGDSDHLFTQEFEIGLPHRFQIAYENDFEVIGPHAQETVQAVEVRYALADWGKLPLNPTLFAEFHFGLGNDYGRQGEDTGGKVPDIPDSFEGRILFGQQLSDKLQWALNIFREQELGGEREWETGFAQSLSYAIFDEYFKVGAEMEFTRRTDAGSRSDAQYEFDIGPGFTFKPSRQTRLDIAPLFGTTGDSPAAKIFMVFSYNFGSVEEGIEEPVSTQNR